MSSSIKRPVAMLLLIDVALFAVAILFNVFWVQHVNREFCQVIRPTVATPVTRPADPAANPSRETDWDWYERFLALNRQLGC